MYINTGTEITNTPNVIKAGYNTWPYYAPKADWYQPVSTTFTDVYGNRQEWNSWNPPKLINIPGGMYKGTPTRTGGFYIQNTIVDPRLIPDKQTALQSYCTGMY